MGDILYLRKVWLANILIRIQKPKGASDVESVTCQIRLKKIMFEALQEKDRSVEVHG